MDQLDNQLAQFITDPSFRRYVLQQEDRDVQYWENWQDIHPDKIELLDRAKAIVQMLDASRTVLPAGEVNKHWEVFQDQLEQSVTEAVPPVKRRISWFFPLLGVAASCLIALAIWLVPGSLEKLGLEAHVLSTGYGEKQEVVLPDGSLIIMNANSSLTYYTPWDTSKMREVWYTGEGFFEVVHLKAGAGQRFQVHLDDLRVEVLGTSFNVNNRRNKTQVVLQEGAIELTHEENSDTLTMVPGELVEYADNELFIKRHVDPDAYSAWTNNRIIFEESSLRSIGEMIVDRYGLNVEIVGNESFARRTFSGEAIVENLKDFIVLLESFDIVVSIEEDQMRISELAH